MKCIVHGVAKSQTRLSNFHFLLYTMYPQSCFQLEFWAWQRLGRKSWCWSPEGRNWDLHSYTPSSPPRDAVGILSLGMGQEQSQGCSRSAWGILQGGQGWNKFLIWPDVVGIWKGSDVLENSIAVSQMIKQRVTMWPSSSSPRYILKRNENICLHRNLDTDVYSSIIHNSWKQSKFLSTE